MATLIANFFYSNTKYEGKAKQWTVMLYTISDLRIYKYSQEKRVIYAMYLVQKV
jgi:hypothetical protein